MPSSEDATMTRVELHSRRLAIVAACLSLYPILVVIDITFHVDAEFAVWPMRIGACGYVLGTPVFSGLAAYHGRGLTRWVAASVLFLWLFVLAFVIYQFVGRCCLPRR
jgi:peptidoglycan/LPS O-acetylase OafA/YrhL